MSTTNYRVHLGNVTDVRSDLLLLKHAGAFFGADQAVSSVLVSVGACQEKDLWLEPDDFAVVETKGAIASSRVMFLGTPPLLDFGYDQMRHFAEKAIESLASQKFLVEVMSTTVHGTGYGLDGGESLQRLIEGFEAGLSRWRDHRIREIIFVTLGERAHRILTSTLAGLNLPRSARTELHTMPGTTAQRPKLVSAVAGSAKKRVFVAMPFSDQFDNVYEFGIYPAVRSCDLICERVDETHFTGDILERIKHGIETAAVVIADLTEARPNVYLEVGYAWGRGTQVIFLARNGEKLHFDVSGQRCIYYGRFAQLATELEKLLRGLEASGQI